VGWFEMAKETTLRCRTCNQVETWDDVLVVTRDGWRIYHCRLCGVDIGRSRSPISKRELARRIKAAPVLPPVDVASLLDSPGDEKPCNST
jgi:hypothetical protein